MNNEEQTQFSVTPTHILMPAEGGEVVLTVNASNPNTPWMAESGASWAEIKRILETNGVCVTVAPTASVNPRSVVLVIAGQNILLEQEPAASTFQILYTPWTSNEMGYMMDLSIQTNMYDIPWVITNHVEWLSFSRSQGYGPEQLTFYSTQDSPNIELNYSPDELSTPKLATLIIGNTLIKIHATSV